MKHTATERAALDAALSRLKLDIDDQKQELLLDHLKLVIEKNKVLNLTRITSFDDAVRLHIEDSLAVLPEFMQTQGRFLDIGTGGGFPGLPLGIVTGREGVLMDSVKKKAAAVQEFIDELGMGETLSTSGLRSEELALEEPEAFDVVIARAVASMPTVLELGAPNLRSKGFLLALKGSESVEDEKRAEIASEKLGFQLVSSRKFDISDGLYERSIYLYQKINESQINLPRRPGMAAKKPIA